MMITNVAPEESYYYDTYCTLNFATKSRKIVNSNVTSVTVDRPPGNHQLLACMVLVTCLYYACRGASCWHMPQLLHNFHGFWLKCSMPVGFLKLSAICNVSWKLKHGFLKLSAICNISWKLKRGMKFACFQQIIFA